MIAVIQRVKRASVEVDKRTVGSCEQGLLILLGVCVDDTREDADALSKKIANLRIFTDENDKMNLSVRDVDGEMLVVSNFTLLANYRKGNRPDYLRSAPPQMAQELYEYFTSLMRQSVRRVETGCFGEHMEINMVGDGPITIVMDSNVLLKKDV